MNTKLELVSDRGVALPKQPPSPPGDHHPVFMARARRSGAAARRTRKPPAARELLGDERGAITAEYAVVILAAVAFAGLLVAIMRSAEIRAMLVQLVENALGSGG